MCLRIHDPVFKYTRKGDLEIVNETLKFTPVISVPSNIVDGRLPNVSNVLIFIGQVISVLRILLFLCHS